LGSGALQKEKRTAGKPKQEQKPPEQGKFCRKSNLGKKGKGTLEPNLTKPEKKKSELGGGSPPTKRCQKGPPTPE